MVTQLTKKREIENERLAEIESAREEERPVRIPFLNPKEYQQELNFIVAEICDKLGISVMLKTIAYAYAKELDKFIRTGGEKSKKKDIYVIIDKYRNAGIKIEILQQIAEKIESSPYLNGR